MREGRAECLMKGSLHTDELMGAVVARDGGLRTARRISHCFVMDVSILSPEAQAEIRLRVINAVRAGMKQAQAARTFGVSRWSVD